jgi:predicted CopG family antitoxin
VRTLTEPGVSVHDKCMAVKTITIDIEAYETLARLKRPGQSFSQVIKARFAERRGRDLAAALDRVALERRTLDAIEARLSARRRDRGRAVRL